MSKKPKSQSNSGQKNRKSLKSRFWRKEHRGYLFGPLLAAVTCPLMLLTFGINERSIFLVAVILVASIAPPLLSPLVGWILRINRFDD